MAAFSARRIEWSEKEALAQMAIQYFKELDKAFVPLGDWRESYPRSVIQQEGSFAWWAVECSLNVGFIVFRIIPHRYRPVKIGFIDELYILPEFRRKGLGKELVMQVIGFMQSQDVERIDIAILSDNESARKFWTWLKFRKVSYNYRLDLHE